MQLIDLHEDMPLHCTGISLSLQNFEDVTHPINMWNNNWKLFLLGNGDNNILKIVLLYLVLGVLNPVNSFYKDHPPVFEMIKNKDRKANMLTNMLTSFSKLSCLEDHPYLLTTHFTPPPRLTNSDLYIEDWSNTLTYCE